MSAQTASIQSYQFPTVEPVTVPAPTAGGPIREAKPRVIFTDDDVAEIRRLAAGGVRQVDLARRYGVHPSHICKTLAGQRRCVAND
jgi:hypothetical protein